MLRPRQPPSGKDRYGTPTSVWLPPSGPASKPSCRRARKLLDELEGRHHGRQHFEAAHPEALRRLELLEPQIKTAAYDMDVERMGLDGIAPQRPNVPQHDRGLAREHVLDRSMGLEL